MSRRKAAMRIERAFKVAGAGVTHESGYPGCKPTVKYHIQQVCKGSY